MYSSREFKINLINALEDRGVYFRRVNELQYQTRCPSCGDKRDNINTGHLYIRINANDNSLIVYNCFRCPYHGVLTPDDLSLLDVDTPQLIAGLEQLNKKGAKYDSKNISNAREVSYDLTVPAVSDERKLNYINERLGTNFTADMCSELRLVPSLGEFLNANGIKRISCPSWQARNLHDNYVGFLTSNGSHILFRDVTNKQKFRWVKYDIFSNEMNDVASQKNFYALPVALDTLSTDEIIVNMSEGVMDILSIAYNLGYRKDNCLNVAVGGKYYVAMFNKLIHMGLVGKNVQINIFADNDKTYDTSIAYYKKKLSIYKPMFGKITVYYNLRSKDCGVRKEEISLDSYRI